jgi:hypothetical protein
MVEELYPTTMWPPYPVKIPPYPSEAVSLSAPQPEIFSKPSYATVLGNALGSATTPSPLVSDEPSTSTLFSEKLDIIRSNMPDVDKNLLSSLIQSILLASVNGRALAPIFKQHKLILNSYDWALLSCQISGNHISVSELKGFNVPLALYPFSSDAHNCAHFFSALRRTTCSFSRADWTDHSHHPLFDMLDLAFKSRVSPQDLLDDISSDLRSSPRKIHLNSSKNFRTATPRNLTGKYDFPLMSRPLVQARARYYAERDRVPRAWTLYPKRDYKKRLHTLDILAMRNLQFEDQAEPDAAPAAKIAHWALFFPHQGEMMVPNLDLWNALRYLGHCTVNTLTQTTLLDFMFNVDAYAQADPMVIPAGGFELSVFAFEHMLLHAFGDRDPTVKDAFYLSLPQGPITTRMEASAVIAFTTIPQALDKDSFHIYAANTHTLNRQLPQNLDLDVLNQTYPDLNMVKEVCKRTAILPPLELRHLIFEDQGLTDFLPGLAGFDLDSFLSGKMLIAIADVLRDPVYQVILGISEGVITFEASRTMAGCAALLARVSVNFLFLKGKDFSKHLPVHLSTILLLVTRGIIALVERLQSSDAKMEDQAKGDEESPFGLMSTIEGVLSKLSSFTSKVKTKSWSFVKDWRMASSIPEMIRLAKDTLTYVVDYVTYLIDGSISPFLAIRWNYSTFIAETNNLMAVPLTDMDASWARGVISLKAQCTTFLTTIISLDDNRRWFTPNFNRASSWLTASYGSAISILNSLYDAPKALGIYVEGPPRTSKSTISTKIAELCARFHVRKKADPEAEWQGVVGRLSKDPNGWQPNLKPSTAVVYCEELFSSDQPATNALENTYVRSTLSGGAVPAPQPEAALKGKVWFVPRAVVGNSNCALHSIQAQELNQDAGPARWEFNIVIKPTSMGESLTYDSRNENYKKYLDQFLVLSGKERWSYMKESLTVTWTYQNRAKRTTVDKLDELYKDIIRALQDKEVEHQQSASDSSIADFMDTLVFEDQMRVNNRNDHSDFDPSVPPPTIPPLSTPTSILDDIPKRKAKENVFSFFSRKIDAAKSFFDDKFVSPTDPIKRDSPTLKTDDTVEVGFVEGVYRRLQDYFSEIELKKLYRTLAITAAVFVSALVAAVGGYALFQSHLSEDQTRSSKKDDHTHRNTRMPTPTLKFADQNTKAQFFSISEKTRKSLFWVSSNGLSTLAFHFHNGLCLLQKHLFGELLAPPLVSYTFHGKKEEATLPLSSIIVIPECDLVCIKLNISGPSLRKLFVTREESLQFESATYIGKTIDLLDQTLEVRDIHLGEPMTTVKRDGRGGTHSAINQVGTYAQATDRGMCGGVAIAHLPQYKIAMQHHAGIGPTGAFAPLTFELVEALITAFNSPGRIDKDAEDQCVLDSSPSAVFSCSVPYGRLKRPNFMPPVTHIVKSNLDLGPCNTLPTHITTFTNTAGRKQRPEEYLIGVMEKTPPGKDVQALVEEASYGLAQELCGRDQRIPLVLTDDQVDNGVPGTKIGPVTLKGSPGYIFVQEKQRMKSGGKGKAPFMTFDPVTEKRVRHPFLIQRLAMLEKNLRADIMPEYLCALFFKSERKPIPKVIAGNTRLIYSSPMDYGMLAKKYCGAFNEALKRDYARWEGSIKVGINAASDEWNTLFEQLFGFSPKWLEIDYSKWDRWMITALRSVFARIMNEWYDLHYPENTPELNRFRVLIMESSKFPLVIFRSLVFYLLIGKDSGHPFTDTENSLMGEVIVRVVFLAHVRENNLPYTLMHYRSLVRNAIYGDDLLCAVKPELGLTQPIFAKLVYEYLGMVATPAANKVDGFEGDYMPPESASFLKRTFKNVDGHVRGPLPIPIIYEMCRWYSDKAGARKEAIFQNCEGAVREAFLHGEPIFNEIRETINAALFKAQITPVSHTYKDLLRMYAKGILLPDYG